MGYRRLEGGAGISLLVPFTPGLARDRDRLWLWLETYWRHFLPDAEIILGFDRHHTDESPFSKTAAVNDAASRARGDIVVILDSDAYVSSDMVLEAAQEIRYAIRNDRRLWFVPYRRFYRVNQRATRRVLISDPDHPWHLPDPPPKHDLDFAQHNPRYGHHYAAMIMVMPRVAFEMVGGMDPRFRGWGGEDISFMRAVDTIYSPHKTLARSAFHLYHDTIGGPGLDRKWQGQTLWKPFTVLGSRYLAAYGDRERMLRLTDEWK